MWIANETCTFESPFLILFHLLTVALEERTFSRIGDCSFYFFFVFVVPHYLCNAAIMHQRLIVCGMCTRSVLTDHDVAANTSTIYIYELLLSLSSDDFTCFFYCRLERACASTHSCRYRCVVPALSGQPAM